MFISRVHIQNFRSLADVEVGLGAYTALVGLNDSGKSNFLRALNLFFNGETDLGRPLDFSNDFSQQAKSTNRKARQIVIEIEFSLPGRYTDKSPVIWQKVFRADSLTPFVDEVYKKDGTDFSQGSKAEYWVRHLAFEYIPAIRGRQFFISLKRRLYMTLASTVAPKLDRAAGTFLSELRKEVKNIEAESIRLLQLKTEFSLPRDLGELFELLDFEAADTHTQTALHYRGDGIQGRHIPLILKFLAEQRKINSAKGKPSSETIWAFEEPENNLELSKQIDVASEFLTYSDSLQILLSTHSPAFYGVAKNSGVILVAARNHGKTNLSQELSIKTIDEHLGLMPFVEPYLQHAADERRRLVEQIKSIQSTTLASNKPALYLEGSSDKEIIKAAFEILFPKFNALEFIAKDGMGGGVNWVVGCCVARAVMPDISVRTAALFDADKEGKKGVENIRTYTESIGKPNKIKSFIVAKQNGDDEVRKIQKSGVKVSLCIEEICGSSAWEYAEKKGWLEERDCLIIDNAHLLSKDKTLSMVLDEKINDAPVRRLIEFKIKDERKGQFAKYVAKKIREEKVVPPTLSALVVEIQKYFM